MRKGVELSPIENNARRSRRNGRGRKRGRTELRARGEGGGGASERAGGEGEEVPGRAGGASGGAFYGEQRTVSRCVRLQRRA